MENGTAVGRAVNNRATTSARAAVKIKEAMMAGRLGMAFIVCPTRWLAKRAPLTPTLPTPLRFGGYVSPRFAGGEGEALNFFQAVGKIVTGHEGEIGVGVEGFGAEDARALPVAAGEQVHSDDGVDAGLPDDGL